MMMPMAINNCTRMTFPALASRCISAELVVEPRSILKTLPAASHTKQKITRMCANFNSHFHGKVTIRTKNKCSRGKKVL